MTTKVEPKKLHIKHARLSFPSLFSTSMFGDEDTGKYDATFLIDKDDTETIDKIKAEGNRLAKAAGIKVPRDRWCLRDGDESEYDGYAGNMSIKASTKKRPTTIDRDRTPLTAENDDKLYAGCYVNGIITLWVQNHPKYGKRVNATLLGVQFLAHGDPFGAAGIDADEFEMLDDLPETETDEITDGDGW